MKIDSAMLKYYLRSTYPVGMGAYYSSDGYSVHNGKQNFLWMNHDTVENWHHLDTIFYKKK